MTSNDILQAPFLDVLFENRNKEYGAYVLRKNYNQRLGVAISFSLALVLSFIFFIMKHNQADDGYVVPEPDEVILRTQVIPALPKEPEPPKPLKPNPPAAPVATKTFTQIRIVKTLIDITSVPAQTDLTNVAISNTTTDGAPAAPIPATTGTGAETGTKPIEKPAPALANAAPQFPGGADAWARFLSRNLQAPEALEAGEKKTVVVKFFVSEDGTVTHFEVAQSGGAAFDAEVIRVLKKMPKWKPAMQNGAPVSVSFTQPVTFVAMD